MWRSCRWRKPKGVNCCWLHSVKITSLINWKRLELLIVTFLKMVHLRSLTVWSFFFALIVQLSFFCVPFGLLRVENRQEAVMKVIKDHLKQIKQQRKDQRKNKTPHLIANVFFAMFFKGFSSALFNNKKNFAPYPNSFFNTLFQHWIQHKKWRRSLIYFVFFTWSSCTGVSQKTVGKSEASWTEQ